MASSDRQTTNPVIAELARRPYAYDFFRAVRLLEAWHKRVLGASRLPDEDPVRFGQRPTLAFAPSTIESVHPGQPPKILVHFFGLFSPNGPLPLHFTEYALRREMGHFDSAEEAPARSSEGSPPQATGRHDFTLAAFLNIFHHRMISLFYRAWACNQKAVDLDRQESDRRFTTYIGSLFGVGLQNLRQRDCVPDFAKFYYSGRLSGQPRNAEGLQAILQDYFDLPVQVIPFLPRWLPLPSQDLFQLGRSRFILGERLPDGQPGRTIILGARIWEGQLHFRLRLGPLGDADYERFLPGSPVFAQLRDWVRLYVGDELFWDVQLVLRAKEVPATQLGMAGQLGWNTWLKSGPLAQDVDDLIINPVQHYG